MGEEYAGHLLEGHEMICKQMYAFTYSLNEKEANNIHVSQAWQLDRSDHSRSSSIPIHINALLLLTCSWLRSSITSTTLHFEVAARRCHGAIEYGQKKERMSAPRVASCKTFCFGELKI